MPADLTRDASCLLQMRAATVDEEARTVEAVLSTEGRVEMWDWRSGEIVEEVLLSDGVDLPRQVPMLNTHSRWSLGDVLGSVREIRKDGTDTVGRLHFAEDDEDSERAWNKVRQGHVTDVSVGYRVIASTEIQAGQTAKIKGREWKAGSRMLRVATKWKLREASLVPIGADEAAKMRQQHQGAPTMADDPKTTPAPEPVRETPHKDSEEPQDTHEGEAR